jgi:hypothetical protein
MENIMSDHVQRRKSEPMAADQTAQPLRPHTGERVEEGRELPAASSKKRVRKSRKAPQSLVDYYRAPRADPRELLWVLPDRDPNGPSTDDIDAAMSSLPKSDRDLVKTRHLALYVANSDEGRLAPLFGDFFLRAIEPVFRKTPDWPPEPEANGSDVFRRLLSHHAGALHRKVVPRRLVNAVMIAQAILSTRHGLKTHDAVISLSRALGPSAVFGRDQRDARTRPRALGHPTAPLDALRTWLDVLSPWIEMALVAERRAEDAESQLHRLNAINDSLEDDLAGVRYDHLNATSEIAKLSEELRGEKLARQHEVSQIRDSMAGFLADELSGQLGAVREGLGLDPPRTKHSLERLDDAEHAIKGKVKWLRSSG